MSKVAVISGGASGIGQSLAIEYAKAGINTVVNYYPSDPHDVQQTVDAVEEAGAECSAVAGDVSKTEDVNALMEAAIEKFGRIDIVVANAGIVRTNTIEEMTDDDWFALLDVDLSGVMRMFRAAAPHLPEGGTMIGVSSISGGVYGWDNHSHYAAAKAGVVGLVRSVAVELGPRGIRVNAVVPGLIESPQSLDEKNSLGKSGLEAAAQNIPLRRAGQVAEVAQAIQFLTSDAASYITGQEIVIDGGLTVSWPA